MEDNKHLGHRSMLKTDKNIKKSIKLFKKISRSISQHSKMIKDMVKIDRQLKKILHDRLHMIKVCAKMVPKHTQEQKDNTREICSDILKCMKEEQPVYWKKLPSVMKLGLISMIKKHRGNPCAGKLPHHQE